jgi:hypothetical protein
MSMKSLPTEVDLHILEYLCASKDRSALSALSCVSKYWRQETEPFLYRDLKFRASEDINVKRLLLTLLARKELHPHITSFTLADHRGVGNFDKDYLNAYDDLAHDLWPQDQLIKAAINAIPDLPARLAMEIHGCILSRGGTLLHQQRPMDASVALILAMAANIESVDLAVSAPAYMDITREIIGCPQVQRIGVPLSAPKILQKLQSIRYHGEHDGEYGGEYRPDVQGLFLIIQSGAQELVIQDICVDEIMGASYLTSTQNLQKLTLQSVDISPFAVGELLEHHDLNQLTSFKLDNLPSKDRSWVNYDYSELSKMIVKCLPNLEVFECINVVDSGAIDRKRPFSSLKFLSRLHTLRVDAEILQDFRWIEPFDDGAMLPPNLKHLVLGIKSPKWLEAIIVRATHEGDEFHENRSG